MAEKLRKLPLAFFGKRDISDLTTTIMGDCTAHERTLSHAIPQLFGTIFMFIITVIGLLILDWRMGLCIAAPVPTNVPEMFQNDKMLDKPCGGGLWIHTIFTKERIEKWDGSLLGSEVKAPYKITLGKKYRVIRMIFTATEIIELNPDFVGHKLFIS